MSLTVAQLVARLSADTSGFYKGMAVANSSMVRTGGIIGRVAAGAGIATLAMGFMAVRAAGDFQQSMNILQAVSGSTGKQLDVMRQKAIALGADLKLPNTSAKDAADAMVELSKGGLSVNQILTATRGTIQLSLAANQDLASSAQVVARALKAFNLQGDQATTVANLLAAAANKSTAEFSDLELGIQNASAQFTGAGYNIQTLTVALAELADRGLNGSIAGTSLKYMLQRLENPTTKAAAALKQMNFHLADSTGHILPLRDIIAQFSRGLANQTQVQKQQTLNTIFGQRANAAMFKLVQGGTGAWDKYSKSIIGNNAAQKMAEARTKGFNGALQGFQSAVETMAIKLGTPLLGPLTRAIHATAVFIESLNTDHIIAFFSAIFGGIGAIVSFVAHSTTMLSILGALTAGFIAFKVISGVIGIITGIRDAMLALNATMLANPFVLAAAAIIAVGVALYILYQRSATARRIMNDIWAFMVSTLGPAFRWIANVVGEAASYIIAHWSQIKSFLIGVFNAIVGAAKSAWGLIGGQVKSAMNTISQIFHAVWPAILDLLKGTWSNIKTIVTTGIHAVGDVIKIYLDIIRGHWSKAWHDLIDLVKTVLSGLAKVIGTALSAAGKAVYDLAKGVGTMIVHGIVDGIKGAAGSIGSAIKGAATGAISGLAGHLGIHSPSTVTRDKIGKPLAAGIIEGFLLGLNDLPTKIGAALKAKLTAVQTQVSAQMQLFQTKFQRFQSYVDQAFDAISQAHLGPKGRLLQKLTDAHDQAQLDNALAQATKSVTDAQAQMDAALNATYDSDQARNDAIASAQQAMTDALAQQAEAQYQIKIAALQKETADEDKEYQARRNLQKQHLDDMLARFEAQMQKHPERAAYWQKKITQTLNDYGITYQSSGEAMGTAFAEGLKQSEHAIEEEIKKIAHIIARYLRLRSPAEAGPLSDLDRWWDPFAKTLTRGLDTDLIRSGALGMAQAARGEYSSSVISGLTSSSTKGDGTVTQIVVPVSGNTFLTSERETLRALANALATVSPNNDSRLQIQTT